MATALGKVMSFSLTIPASGGPVSLGSLLPAPPSPLKPGALDPAFQYLSLQISGSVAYLGGENQADGNGGSTVLSSTNYGRSLPAGTPGAAVEFMLAGSVKLTEIWIVGSAGDTVKVFGITL